MKKKSGRKKTEILFDENDRKSFLTGFKRRKQERKDHALKKFETQVKRERQRVKKEKRDACLGVVSKIQPDNCLLTAPTDTHELKSHTVTITPIITTQFSPASLLSISQESEDCEVPAAAVEDSVPGMELVTPLAPEENHEGDSNSSRRRTYNILRAKKLQLEKRNNKKTLRVKRRRKGAQNKLMKKSHKLKKHKH